jgi:drug/metabolite transporter (DMT)-like permease
MGILFFKERLGAWEMLGISLILVGVFLTFEHRKKKPKNLNADF